MGLRPRKGNAMSNLTLTAKARSGAAPALKASVATLAEAGERLSAWIMTYGLGASDCHWQGRYPDGHRHAGMKCGVGVVKNGRAVVAHVAYNGRVFDARGTEVVA